MNSKACAIWFDRKIRELQFMDCCCHFRNLEEIAEMSLASRSFAERPQIGQNLLRNAATLIRDSYDNMLWRLTNQDLDGWQTAWDARVLLNHGLNRISDDFANNILQLTENVWKSCIQMTIQSDFWQDALAAVSFCHKPLALCPQSSTTSRALHFKKTSPTNSALGS